MPRSVTATWSMSAARRGREAACIPLPSCPAKAGHPVRRGFSAESLTSLEYWIVRPSAQLRTRRTMTVEDDPTKNAGVSPAFLFSQR
jgi:hypothetical protein